MADRRKLDGKIAENLALRDRLEQLRKELEEMKNADVKQTAQDYATSATPERNDARQVEADRILFERIVCEIKERELYRNPDFSRAELIKTIPVAQNRFARLFKQFAGMPFSAFIQELRLEYASKLFIKHPNWSTDAVIKECCMSRSSFYTLFAQVRTKVRSNARRLPKKCSRKAEKRRFRK